MKTLFLVVEILYTIDALVAPIAQADPPPPPFGDAPVSLSAFLNDIRVAGKSR